MIQKFYPIQDYLVHPWGQGDASSQPGDGFSRSFWTCWCQTPGAVCSSHHGWTLHLWQWCLAILSMWCSLCPWASPQHPDRDWRKRELSTLTWSPAETTHDAQSLSSTHALLVATFLRDSPLTYPPLVVRRSIYHPKFEPEQNFSIEFSLEWSQYQKRNKDSAVKTDAKLKSRTEV